MQTNLDLSQITYRRTDDCVEVRLFSTVLFTLPASETTAGCERAIAIFKQGWKCGEGHIKMQITDLLTGQSMTKF
jgi:hypothetical protein